MEEQIKPEPMTTKERLLELTKAKHPYADEETCIFALILLNFPSGNYSKDIPYNFADKTKVDISTAMKAWNMINPDINHMYFDNWQIPRYRYMLQCMKHLKKQLPTETDIHKYRQNGQLLDMDSEMVVELMREGLIRINIKEVAGPIEVKNVRKHIERTVAVKLCNSHCTTIELGFDADEATYKLAQDQLQKYIDKYIEYKSMDGDGKAELVKKLYNDCIMYLSFMKLDVMYYLSLYANLLCNNGDAEQRLIDTIVVDTIIVARTVVDEVSKEL